MGDCSNHRPMSMIVVAYKILAHIMLRRLESGGTAQPIVQNKFGLKSNNGTIDALF